MQEGCGWPAWFFNNHDQPRAISRFGDASRYHYELATSLACLTHMMRGTPYIYQGEEIGMTNPSYSTLEEYRDYESINYYKILRAEGQTKETALKILQAKSRDNGRSPIRWDSSEFGGFSNIKPWIGLNQDININYEENLKNPKSIFYFYQKMIKLRKEHEAISHGFYEKIYFDEQLYIFRRYYAGEEIIVLLNFSENIQQISRKFAGRF